MAGRGLTRDLADQPDAALVAVTAQLFKVLALNGHVGAEASALRISAVGVAGKAADDGLDGEVNARLEARRQAYLESGQRPIAWVTGLPQDERLALLAELAAVTLDLREARPSALRPAARIEAAEIAALCGADLARRWTPDAAFLAVHSRAQLLGFLADMGATAPSDAGLRKAELVRFVAEAAAERRWLPACLRWDAVAAEAAPDIEGDGAEADPAGQPPEPEGGTVPEEASPAATLAA
jgi:ParB family chromosome partitioning protein